MFGRSSETQDASGEDSRRQRLLLVIVGGLAVIAILGVVFIYPMFSGSSSDDAVAVPAATRPTKPKPPASPTQPTAVEPPAPEVEPNASTRDPFAPLPQEVAAMQAASAPITTSGTGAATGGATVDGAPTTPTVATTGTAAQAAPPQTGTAATTGKPVQLIAVSGGTAKVEVDSVAYPVQAGGTFASGYQAVTVTADSITIKRGDRSVKLALGELQNL